MKDEEIQRFIMGWYLSDPHLDPAVPDRHEHGGTMESILWSAVGRKSTPARSRIDRAFRRLEARGWLRSTDDPRSPIPVWYLSEPLVNAWRAGDLTEGIDMFNLSVTEAMRLRLYSNDLGLFAVRQW